MSSQTNRFIYLVKISLSQIYFIWDICKKMQYVTISPFGHKVIFQLSRVVIAPKSVVYVMGWSQREHQHNNANYITAIG